MHPILRHRPLVVALAGSNGAGKSTYYHAFLKATGLPFINADEIKRATGIGDYDAKRECIFLWADLLGVPHPDIGTEGCP